MDAARWEQVQRVFHDALAVPPAERNSFLDAACAGDDALRAAVVTLIDNDGATVPVLDRDLSAVAGAILDNDEAAGPTLGATIGRYRLVSLLGEGGMGVVYRAERDDLKSVVAIKILRHAWMSPARRDRFTSEQHILAQLNHPAIAQLHDADVLPDGTPWFAMEFVQGRPLTDYCASHAPTIAARLKLFRTVCEAVQYAHGHLIVHRDLKPSNVLVRADGAVKLLDFGISKQLESDAADPTLTVFRPMTPAYAAPEQVRGGRTGVYTDMYSLGVMLYELLTGQRPFDVSQRTPEEALAIIAEANPVRPSLVKGRLPATRAAWSDLNVLCLTAMRKEPERRYATVEALVRDIDHYLAGEPLEARPDSVVYRANKFARRNWRGLAVAGTVAAVMLGLSGYFAWSLAAARASAETEALRSRRIQQFMQGLFEGGDVAEGPRNDLRVVTLVERGVDQARALAAEPVVQADLYQTLGGILQKLGDFRQAETMFTAALERRRSLFGDRDPASAASLVDLGLLRVDLAQLDEAERSIRQGVEAAQAARAGPLAVGRATAALGKVLEAKGAYPDAIKTNEEAVRLYTEGGDTEGGLMAALAQLADSHYYAGHYDVADDINTRVLADYRRLYGENHPRVADVLINLGATRTDRGRYDEAVPYYRQALASLTTFFGPEHFRTGSAMTMLGRALVYQKAFAEGVPLLRRALAIQERTNGPVHPRVASALNDLGAAALAEERLDEAEAAYRRMLEIYRSVYAQEHYLVGIATSNLASVFVARKQYDRAESLYRDAIGLFERTQSPQHLNVAIARVKLGRALLRRERFREAEREILGGYEILRAQASPSITWIQAARTDLVAVYEALGAPEKAAPYR